MNRNINAFDANIEHFHSAPQNKNDKTQNKFDVNKPIETDLKGFASNKIEIIVVQKR
jgi:hypothetical protein